MTQHRRSPVKYALRGVVTVTGLLLMACVHVGPVPVSDSPAPRQPTEPLRAPEGFYMAASSAGDFDGCPEPSAPFTGALDFPSKYQGSDDARDDLNEEAERRYQREIADITALERGINDLVEAYLESGDPAAVQCAVDWLADWARAGAMTAEATTHTGKSMRKWSLGSVSSAYLRLKLAGGEPLAPHAAETAIIDDWLRELGELVMADWSNVPPEKFNNHEYWAAWSVMATAVVLDERAMFDWAVAQYRTAAQQITRNGYLPNELSRDSRALFYHNYALPPLTMIAAFARVNGLALLSENGGAVQRLAERVISGADDPSAFVEKTGSPQKPAVIKDSKFTWLEPYCALISCSPRMRAKRQAVRPLNNYRVGGNLTDIFANQGIAESGSAPAGT